MNGSLSGAAESRFYEPMKYAKNIRQKISKNLLSCFGFGHPTRRHPRTFPAQEVSIHLQLMSGSAPPQNTSAQAAPPGVMRKTEPRSAVPPGATKEDQAVLAYLRKRGLQGAAAAMQMAVPATAPGAYDESCMTTVLGITGRDEASRFETSYSELRSWVDGSLDMYKSELHSVLYPCLVHCFLEIVRRGFVERARAFLNRWKTEFMDGAAGRREELLALGGVASQQHLSENATAKLFLNNRYELHLTSYAFELVFSFLSDDARRAVLLRILNQRCHVRQHVDGAARASAGGIAKTEAGVNGQGACDPVFVPADEKSGQLKHELLWGKLPPSLYIIPDSHEVEAAEAAAKKAKDEASAADGATPMTGVTGANGATPGKGAAALAAAKKEGAKDVGKDGKGKGDENEEASDKPHVLPDGTISDSYVPLKRYRPKAQGLDSEEDIKARAALGWRSKILAESGTGSANESADQECVLPSVLCYTFTNTKGEGLNCSAVSTDGAQVVGGFGDSSVRLWDARVSGTPGSGAQGLSGRPSRLLGHSGPVYSVDWTRCGRFVLSGSEDGTVRLWTALHRADLVAYRGHNYPIWSVAFSPLDHYFASGGHDRTARIWSTDRIYPLRILAGHLADVDVVRWHPNCNYLATGSSDRTARLWDVRAGKSVRVLGARGTVHALAFSPDGSTLAVAGDDPVVETWDIRSGKRMQRLPAHKGTVWALDYSKDGAVLASGCADQSVGLWDAKGAASDGEPKPLARLRTKDTPIHDVSFTRRNLLVASGNFATGV